MRRQTSRSGLTHSVLCGKVHTVLAYRLHSDAGVSSPSRLWRFFLSSTISRETTDGIPQPIPRPVQRRSGARQGAQLGRLQHLHRLDPGRAQPLGYYLAASLFLPCGSFTNFPLAIGLGSLVIFALMNLIGYAGEKTGVPYWCWRAPPSARRAPTWRGRCAPWWPASGTARRRQRLRARWSRC